MLSLLIKIFCPGWPGGWVAGSAENKAQLSSTAVAVEVEIEAELGKYIELVFIQSSPLYDQTPPSQKL